MERITGAMLMRDPDLQPRDVAILLCLIGEMDPGTGRVNLATSELAKLCGVRQSNVSLSLSRLKKKLLVINRRDKATKGFYMLVNPDFASVGGNRTRAIAAKQFKQEWIDSLIEETGGDRQRAFATWEQLIDSGRAQASEHEQLIEEAESDRDIVRQAGDKKLQEFLQTC